jgi:hypothetical protein
MHAAPPTAESGGSLSAVATSAQHPTTDPTPYENWRPPLIWVAGLILVEPHHLLVNHTSEQGTHLLPGSPVPDGRTPAEAALHILLGTASGLPIHRQVAIDATQLRRRLVSVHLFASHLIPRDQAKVLSALDARATIRILPFRCALSLLPPRARTRAEIGLGALQTGNTVHLNDGLREQTGLAQQVSGRTREQRLLRWHQLEVEVDRGHLPR